MTAFSVGSLVRARGREWVVLPSPSGARSDAEQGDDLVMVRPLGGTDAEVTGILAALEEVLPATFDLPDPTRPGDERSARLLRDALRLGFRSSAGPFRCFGRLAVEPRPYQLVPLLMALKLDPVRLLIADDVGIGKTVEAGLVAAELLEQGDARRLAVLCPPHLAEQWHTELATKFHIDAEVVLASTAARLERNLGVGRTIFDAHPFVVVSTDFIKSDRRRDDFLRTCPELVIVDEAHTCAYYGAAGGRLTKGHHQRHELVAGLAADPERHLILVTATPHSGKEGAFRSLLELVDPHFAALPDDLSGDANRAARTRLATHLVQRRRADIRAYLDADTPFPKRLEREETYRLTPEYRSLFDRALDYAREIVRDPEGGNHRQRVRWWSALALLRSLASSPAAAADTLANRAAPAGTATAAEADEVGRRTVLDQAEDDEAESPDVAPGSDIGPDPGGEGGDAEAARSRRALRDMARAAEALRGDGDAKLVHAARLVSKLVQDGARPIVFCRFIPTAEYVAGELRARLPRGVEVVAVTGTLAPREREARIEGMAAHDRRVLVATDCLSEGINLQDSFDAVFHYDLPWNPTRLEQREGRVDRFGQRRPEVRVVTYYGEDNQIDEIVLEVLLRKHRAIRNSLGISVPVPGDTGAVIDAVAENLLIRQDHGGISERLPGMDEFLRPTTEQLLLDWTDAAEREKRSRTIFAQSSIKVEEVAQELAAVQAAIGSGADVASFTASAVVAHGGTVARAGDGAVAIDLSEAPLALRDALGAGAIGDDARLKARFALPVAEDERFLSRTDPLVAGLASYVLDTALDPLADSAARRCGVIRTDAVAVRTTLLLVRYRFHLVVTRDGAEHPLLAEDCAVLGFTGPPTAPRWLDPEAVPPLLEARASANVDPALATDFLGEVVEHAGGWQAHLDEDARARADALHQAHQRVRTAASQRGVRHRVEPQLPPDLLGIYVYLPAPTKGDG
jgi:superfamily II DNA or RNA helicase